MQSQCRRTGSGPSVSALRIQDGIGSGRRVGTIRSAVMTKQAIWLARPRLTSSRICASGRVIILSRIAAPPPPADAG